MRADTQPVDECEIKIGGDWTVVGIDDALRSYGDEIKRCPECHGRVRAHKAGTTDQRAHFEHMVANPGCTLKAGTFSGRRARHPHAID
jgi:hypothetical protein